MTKGALAAVAALVGVFSAQTAFSNSVISRDFSGNDCSGFFGTGFDSCTIFVNDNGVRIELSPVIAKYGGDLSLSETNGTVYPSIDGSEFSFSNNIAPDNKTGTWDYNPGIDDPGVRFWATKAGPNFKLFWEVSDAAAAGVCNVVDTYTLGCLNEALVVATGDWTTPDNKELSHITFYDSEDPVVIPVPAAVWLFGSGLLGLVGIARRKQA